VMMERDHHAEHPVRSWQKNNPPLVRNQRASIAENMGMRRQIAMNL